MGVLDQTAGIHSKEARISPKAYQEWLANTYGTGQKGFNGINNRISQLLESAYSGGLDSKGKKELGNLLYYVRTNNPNYKEGKYNEQHYIIYLIRAQLSIQLVEVQKMLKV